MEKCMFYIIHYTKLVNRKLNLEKALKERNLNYIFLENFDRENLDKKDYVKFSEVLINRSNGALCANFLCHIEAMRMITESNYEYNIILEDDVLLDKDFNSIFEKSLLELPEDNDLFFIGEGCNYHISNKLIKKDVLVYKRLEGSRTRSADSILYSKKACKKILDWYETCSGINLAIDHWLNLVISDQKLVIYWLEPTITRQGSLSIYPKSY